MDRDALWYHIDTQRAAAADILAGLTEEHWGRPSLCDGWTVRDVAVHLAWQDVKVREVLVPLLRARFDTDVMIRDTAIRSPITHDQIVAKLRGFAGRRIKPPFVADTEPLIDVLVHTQDVCVPLSIEHVPSAEPVIVALDRTVKLNEGRMALGPPVRGVRLVATDADWQHGSGKVIEGPLIWLLLTVAGRRAAHAHLSGEVSALS